MGQGVARIEGSSYQGRNFALSPLPCFLVAPGTYFRDRCRISSQPDVRFPALKCLALRWADLPSMEVTLLPVGTIHLGDFPASSKSVVLTLGSIRSIQRHFSEAPFQTFWFVQCVMGPAQPRLT
jgi:hypothetical protein